MKAGRLSIFRHALTLLLLLSGPLFSAAGQDTNLLSRLEPVPPLPELRAAAKHDGIPLDDFTSGNGTNALSPGDSATALITLHQKKNRRTQWLVYFQVIADTNRLSKPSKPLVLYTSAGDKFTFARSRAMFSIRTIGPFVNSAFFWGEPAPKDESISGISVNKGFLSLGLDKGAAAIHRWNLAKTKTGQTNFNFWVSQRPLKTAKTNQIRKVAALLQVTPEEERAVAGSNPALSSYFDAVGQTPDLESIMWKVVSLPSAWSIVKHVGITAWIGIDIEDIVPISLPQHWDLPRQAPVYTLPLMVTLNRQPALNVTLFVTDPHPPLLACGGIVGFLAQDPADDENYVTLRIISGHFGKSGK